MVRSFFLYFFFTHKEKYRVSLVIKQHLDSHFLTILTNLNISWYEETEKVIFDLCPLWSLYVGT